MSEVERLRREVERLRGQRDKAFALVNEAHANDKWLRLDDLREALRDPPALIEAGGGLLFTKTGEERVLEEGEFGVGGDGHIVCQHNSHPRARYEPLRPVVDMRECIGLLRACQTYMANHGTYTKRWDELDDRLQALLDNVPALPERGETGEGVDDGR